MGNDSNPIQITASGTTTIGSCFLYLININKVLTGTVTIKDGSAVLGTIAAATAAGAHHILPSGGRYSNLVVVLSAADDVTAYTKKA